jgi:tetratricopeptide (TPR) repeat protein
MMSVYSRRFSQRVARLVGLVTSIILALVGWNHYVSPRVNAQSVTMHVESNDFGSQAVEYIKQGRYDDAVQVCLRALQNRQSDEGVYQQIAVVYLVRAEKEPGKREQWVEKAISYTEKALSLNSKDRDAAGALLLQEARSFESAGNLSATGRCAYYGKARRLLEDRVSLLRGDQVTLAGKTFPLEPLRKENDKVLAGVKDKAAKAHCE